MLKPFGEVWIMLHKTYFLGIILKKYVRETTEIKRNQSVGAYRLQIHDIYVLADNLIYNHYFCTVPNGETYFNRTNTSTSEQKYAKNTGTHFCCCLLF